MKLSPLELLEQLAALVPLPRAHLGRYGGCLAPHRTRRAASIPTPRQQGVDGEETKTATPLGTGPGCSAAASLWIWRPVFRHCGGGGTRCADAVAPGLAPCRAVAALRLLAAITQARSSPVACVISRWRPSPLLLPRPVVAKHSARSTQPTPAWAHRRGRAAAVSFAPSRGAMPLKSSPQLFRRAAPRPSQSLRRSRHPSYAACPGRALPRGASPRAAAACCGGVLGEPLALRARSGRRWRRAVAAAGRKCREFFLSVRRASGCSSSSEGSANGLPHTCLHRSCNCASAFSAPTTVSCAPCTCPTVALAPAGAEVPPDVRRAGGAGTAKSLLFALVALLIVRKSALFLSSRGLPYTSCQFGAYLMG